MGDGPVERAREPPAPEAVVGALPGAEALGEVPPLCSGLHDPERGVEHEAGGPSGTPPGGSGGEEVGDAIPLRIGEGVSGRKQASGGGSRRSYARLSRQSLEGDCDSRQNGQRAAGGLLHRLARGSRPRQRTEAVHRRGQPEADRLGVFFGRDLATLLRFADGPFE